MMAKTTAPHSDANLKFEMNDARREKRRNPSKDSSHFPCTAPATARLTSTVVQRETARNTDAPFK